MNGEATPSMFAGHSMLCPYEERSVCGGHKRKRKADPSNCVPRPRKPWESRNARDFARDDNVEAE
jgi:hypothetical protein